MEGTNAPGIGKKKKAVRFFKRKTVWAVMVIVVAGGFFLFRPKPPSYATVTVQREDVVQEVTATGSTEPVTSLDLSFERSGTVASVLADVGDTVTAGEPLVRLDTTADQINLAQMQAALASAQATLQNLEAPVQPSDIAVLQSKIAGAESDVAAARQKFVDTLQGAYTGADDAVRNYADQFFDNAQTDSPQVNITVSDAQLKINLDNSRVTVEKTLDAWNLSAAALSVNSRLDAAATSTRSDLEQVRSLLDSLALAVNSLTPTQSLSATTIATYRANISTARTEVNTELSAVTTAQDGLSSAAAALDLARKNLDQTLAGTPPEKIDAQKAQVGVARANVASAQHQIDISVLRSPIVGVVTTQDAKVGQVVTANAPVTSVISKGPLEIQAYVPEVDIGRMGIGASTTVTFDAFPNETFSGTVSYIDPAETVLEGVPTYKVKLALSVDDPRVKPGMTANLTVVIADHPGVLAVPYRAVRGSGADRYVERLLPDGKQEKAPVTVGIRGVTGDVEILSGLSLGDTVVMPSQ